MMYTPMILLAIMQLAGLTSLVVFKLQKEGRLAILT